MKLFCECNSEWVITNLYKQLAIDDECPVCDYHFWYDADYENMMFDLKEMNKC